MNPVRDKQSKIFTGIRKIFWISNGVKLPKGSAGTDLSIFIVFIILLGVIWVSTGGPDRPISRSGPFMESPLSGDGSGVPSVNTGETSGDFITRISQGLADLREGEEKSPYAEYVSLSLSNAKQGDVNNEYVTIKTSRALSGTLTISDWRLESSAGNISVPLGFAAQLPRLGQVHNTSPVAVGANTTVYVVSGRSPIGASFRLNTCTGYFAQFQNFKPRLPLECPYPIEELQEVQSRSPGYTPSPNCYSALSAMNQCEIATGGVQDVDPTCYNFLTNDVSYNGCVNFHQGDGGFYKNEWRIYLGQDTALWPERGERIRLIDETGRVIDAVSY